MTAKELYVKLQGECLTPLETLLKQAGKREITVFKRKPKGMPMEVFITHKEKFENLGIECDYIVIKRKVKK